MSTRAAIGFHVGDEVHTIYCHYDGYPEHVGCILQTHHRSAELAKELVYGVGGHIRSLEPDGTVDRFGEGLYEIFRTPCEAVCGFNYLYIFNNEKQEWVCFVQRYPAPSLKQINIPTNIPPSNFTL